MASTIFNLGAVKLLKKILRFQESDIQIITGNATDPTVTAVDAVSGSLYIRGGTSSLYVKQDNGSTTNWSLISTSAALLNYIPTSEKGVALGVATLDSGGKVPVAQLPNSIMDYRGNWNASTNTPTLADGTGNAGDVYRANVAGTQNLGSGPQTFGVGDWVVYNGSIWEKSSNSNAVMSVNGFTGVVVLSTDDIAEGAVNKYYTSARFTTDFASKSTTNLTEGTNLYFTAARAKTAAVADAIVDGVTDVAPSQNAVFDALALKGSVTTVSSANADIAVANGSTTPTLTLNSGTGASQIVKRNGSSQIDAATQKIVNVVDPTAAQDAATKAYADTKQSKGVTTLVSAANASMGSTVTNEVITGLTFAHATFNGATIDYRIKKGTLVRTGKLLVATDGTTISLNDSFVETQDSTIVFDAVINGANININHTNTETGTIVISFEQNLFPV
jgi:hypothetical protein